MKKVLLSAFAIYLTVHASLFASQPDSIKVFCSKTMYSLVSRWSREFNSTLSECKVSVSELTGTVKNLPGHWVAIVDGKSLAQGNNQWRMIVGRDVIVPVISADNPLVGKIRSKGISPENLSRFIKDAGSRNWGKLLGTNDSQPAGFYLVNDESLKEGLSGFLETEIKTTGYKLTADARELFTVLAKDHFAIGFCKMISLTDKSNEEYTDKIALVPIDRNSDGVIDHNEDIYEDLTAFSRGVWIGKYPRALTSGICAIAPEEIDSRQAEFLRWIISDGQNYLDQAGFTQLLAGEKQTGIDRLVEIAAPAAAAPVARSIFSTLLYIIIILVITGLVAEFIIRLSRRTTQTASIKPLTHHVLDENSVILPGGIFFDKAHTWAFMEQNGVVKVGVDDFLHHVTGEITKLVLKNEGDFIKKGDELLAIVRNGKHLTLYSPVTGTIVGKNRNLDSDIQPLNKTPYEEGWIYRIQPVNWLAESQLLIMADKYRLFINSEIIKLKEFLAGFLNNEHPQYASLVLQDGGALIDNPLDTMGPEVWEEFQIKFIDSAKTH